MAIVEMRRGRWKVSGGRLQRLLSPINVACSLNYFYFFPCASSQGWAQCLGLSTRRSTLCGRGAQATHARLESTGPLTCWCRSLSCTWHSTSPTTVSVCVCMPVCVPQTGSSQPIRHVGPYPFCLVVMQCYQSGTCAITSYVTNDVKTSPRRLSFFFSQPEAPSPDRKKGTFPPGRSGRIDPSGCYVWSRSELTAGMVIDRRRTSALG